MVRSSGHLKSPGSKRAFRYRFAFGEDSPAVAVLELHHDLAWLPESDEHALIGDVAKIGRNELCPCGSDRKFKRCHLGNWPPHASQASSAVTQLREPLSFPAFAELVRRALTQIGAHPLTIIASVLRRVRQRIGPLDSMTDDGIHVRIAGAAVLAACYRDGITDYLAQELPISEGVHADHILQQVNTRLEMRFGSSMNQPYLGLLQILCTQGALQGIDAFALFRTLYLLELETFDTSSRASRYDDLFESAYGCTTAEYVAVLQGIWSYAATTGEFIEATFLRESPIADRLVPVARRLLCEHSCRIQGVRAIIDQELGHHGLDGLVAAFFAKYPFIEHRPGVYTLAPHPYVRIFAFSAPIFRALELARERAGRPDTQESGWMGTRFESLVHDVLFEGFEEPSLVREHDLDVSGSRKSPDLLLFENDGVILLQAKIKRLSPKAFFGFDLDALKSDVDTVIAKTVSKSIAYLSWLDSYEAERTLTPYARSVRERLRAAKSLFLLGVLPAMPSVFHVDEFRKLVWDAVALLLRPAEKEWLDRNHARIRGWHVLDSEELAAFISWRRGWGLHDALVEYVSLPEFGKVLVGDKFVEPFRGYVATRGRRLGYDALFPKVDSTVRRFNDWTLQLLFQKSMAQYSAADTLTR